MPVIFKVDQNQSLCLCTVREVMSVENIIQSFSEILAETDGAALHMNMLWLIDPAALLHPITLPALERLRQAIEGWGKTNPGRNVRTALVAPDETHHAVLRLWKAMTDLHPSLGARVRIFAREAEARAWLESAV